MSGPLVGESVLQVAITAAQTVVTILMGGALMKGYDLYRRRQVDVRTDRRDEAAYWQQVATTQDQKLGRQEKRIDDLVEAHTRCLIESESLRGRLDFLQSTVDNLRSGMDPAYAGNLYPTAYVQTDQDGRITVASPFVTALFHWSEHELIGRSVKRLIPERYHAGHDAGREHVLRTGELPDRYHVYRFHGLTKQGEEFPISVRLKAWKDEGRYVFGAFIQEREDGGVSSDSIPIPPPPGPDSPAPPPAS